MELPLPHSDIFYPNKEINTIQLVLGFLQSAMHNATGKTITLEKQVF
jgi:hypothetical protein